MSRARVTQVRRTGLDDQVLTVTGGSRAYRREPCDGCPWRVDQTGKFSPGAFKASANTAYDGNTHTFACHESGVSKPAICAGFILRNSLNNLGMRFALSRGDVDRSQVGDGGHELHPSYRAMAVANGVDAADPALRLCRADDE